ncbi:MAG TPA: RidA family protein [Solirubrobacterales bacterium]|nr:RidA family protein [Solirubrobacterales bacterium]
MTHPIYLNPAGAPAPIGMYSNLSRAGDLLFVAGQVGLGADGELAGEGLEEQAAQAFENIAILLRSQGATLRDVTKFTTYLVSAEEIARFFVIRERLFPDLFPEGEYPPNTLLVVDRLVLPELRIEVEAIARLG